MRLESTGPPVVVAEPVLSLDQSPRRARRAALAEEAGTTLVELITATAISLIIGVALLAVIPVFVKAQTATARADGAAAAVRTAMVQLQHDIEEAKPQAGDPNVGQLVSVAAYADELQVDLPAGGGSGVTTVTWIYDPATGQLTRQAGSGSAVVEVPDVADGSTPVFAYFDPSGNNLADASGSTPVTIASCTTLVQITLTVAPPGAPANTDTTDVRIENAGPGLGACP